jgi:phage I-like protein
MKDKKLFGLMEGLQICLADVDKEKATSEIQILKAGMYYHEWYGELDLNREVLAAMVKNFDDKVIPNDLMIDYNHVREEAAGWILKMYLKNDGSELWAKIQWTRPGLQHLDDKTYRYISADIHDDYMNAATMQRYGVTLAGAALTNRPFIKGMSPTVPLNELTGGNAMDLKDLQKQNTALSEQVTALKEAKDKEVKALTDMNEDQKKQITALSDEVKALKASNEKNAKEAQFAVLLSTGKAVPAQKDAFIEGDMIKFAELAGAVNPAAKGSAIDPKLSTAELSADQKQDKLIELSDKYAEENKVSHGVAISEVRKLHPELL